MLFRIVLYLPLSRSGCVCVARTAVHCVPLRVGRLLELAPESFQCPAVSCCNVLYWHVVL